MNSNNPPMNEATAPVAQRQPWAAPEVAIMLSANVTNGFNPGGQPCANPGQGGCSAS